jgi:protein-L-isoaspartate(D-aspartate) O-methyltransferase
MVDQEIAREGVTNKLVLASMREVPRHQFVAPVQRDMAYYDQSLPIGHGQTISPPFIVAYMTETLDPQPGDKVLEIGTGSGYQAAVLSGLVKEVYTIEIVEPLGKTAAKRLKDLGYKNVQCLVGDGYKGWPEHAPFDKIIVTCSPESIPQALVDQLREGGRMIIPLGERYDQMFYMLEKKGTELVKKKLLPALFVPMTGTSEAQRKVKPDPLHPQLHNGDFETIEDGLFEGWFYQRQVTAAADSSTPHGKHYLHFENKDAGRGAQVLQGMGVDGAHVSALTITAQVRGKELKFGTKKHEKPSCVFHFFDSDRKPIAQESVGPWQGTFDWKQITGTVRVPNKARECILRMGMNGATGSLDVDDVKLTSESR